jgi:hypothetical protein
MSVGVNMIGDLNLYLGEHGERYDFTIPSAFARSIIAVPWVELGGKAGISCAATGYSAAIIFHTKVHLSLYIMIGFERVSYCTMNSCSLCFTVDDVFPS